MHQSLFSIAEATSAVYQQRKLLLDMTSICIYPALLLLKKSSLLLIYGHVSLSVIKTQFLLETNNKAEVQTSSDFGATP